MDESLPWRLNATSASGESVVWSLWRLGMDGHLDPVGSPSEVERFTDLAMGSYVLMVEQRRSSAASNAVDIVAEAQEPLPLSLDTLTQGSLLPGLAQRSYALTVDHDTQVLFDALEGATNLSWYLQTADGHHIRSGSWDGDTHSWSWRQVALSAGSYHLHVQGPSWYTDAFSFKLHNADNLAVPLPSDGTVIENALDRGAALYRLDLVAGQRSNLSITGVVNGALTWQVVSPNGQVVQSGTRSQDVILEPLVSGVYWLQVDGGVGNAEAVAFNVSLQESGPFDNRPEGENLVLGPSEVVVNLETDGERSYRFQLAQAAWVSLSEGHWPTQALGWQIHDIKGVRDGGTWWPGSPPYSYAIWMEAGDYALTWTNYGSSALSQAFRLESQATAPLLALNSPEAFDGTRLFAVSLTAGQTIGLKSSGYTEWRLLSALGEVEEYIYSDPYSFSTLNSP
ncbi:MAG: hypothetical protein U1E02_11040, partial [Hydrogenophaga sp.]|nr:hypothetical protein [Hydrogenophaga sp.]